MTLWLGKDLQYGLELYILELHWINIFFKILTVLPCTFCKSCVPHYSSFTFCRCAASLLVFCRWKLEEYQQVRAMRFCLVQQFVSDITFQMTIPAPVKWACKSQAVWNVGFGSNNIHTHWLTPQLSKSWLHALSWPQHRFVKPPVYFIYFLKVNTSKQHPALQLKETTYSWQGYELLCGK